jgi:hypothetical protein
MWLNLKSYLKYFSSISYSFASKNAKLKKTFVNPPLSGSKISIIYYKGRNSIPTDESGRRIFLNKEYFGTFYIRSLRIDNKKIYILDNNYLQFSFN